MARRSGLGRGLGALIPPEAAESGSAATSALRDVPVASIRPNPHQPRQHFDEESLSALTASVRELGVLQPVLVREVGAGEFELIAGERRWRAAKRAGLPTIPVLVRAADDLASLEQAVVENLHRQDLNPLEEAAAYRQLLDDLGMTHEDLAERVGRSRAAITNAMRLLGLAPTVQRRIAGGTLTAAHGRAIAGLADAEMQERAAQRVVAQNLSVRQTEDLVRKYVSSGAGLTTRGARSRVERPAAILEIEKRLSDMLDTRVTVEAGRRRGRITIQFAGLEDLDRIWRAVARDNA